MLTHQLTETSVRVRMSIWIENVGMEYILYEIDHRCCVPSYQLGRRCLLVLQETVSPKNAKETHLDIR